jgi:hypothetical protein
MCVCGGEEIKYFISPHPLLLGNVYNLDVKYGKKILLNNMFERSLIGRPSKLGECL